MNRRIDLTGERFGQLTVVEFSGMTPGRNSTWNCVCDCGRETVVAMPNLKSGHTRSCGCLFKGGFVTHGLYNEKLPEYKAWAGARDRCRNPNRKCWKDYGGRGITFAECWDDFEVFLADVGKRPSPKHSLDRINNNGNYEPGNVRWATKAEQMANARSNHVISFNGESLCLSQWARKQGIHHKTLRTRLRRGWPVERALTQDARQV